MAHTSEKYPEEIRLHIGSRKNSGEPAPKLASEYNVSRTTVYRYAKEAEVFQEERGGFQEFGVTGLNRFGGSVQEDYDRQWRTLTDMVPLVKEMLDHPTVGATAFAVEMTMRRSEWLVEPFKLADVEEPAEQDLAAARFLEECKDDMSHTFDDHITQILSMLWYGFAPFEIVYKRRLGDTGPAESKFDDGRIGWRKLAFRAQDTLAPGDEWEIDENGGIQAMRQSAPPSYTPVTIPIDKLILYRTTAAKNNPQGRPFPLDTLVPTPDGWTTIGEIELGDRVFDENGKIRLVVGKSEIFRDRSIYEIEFTAGATIKADASHLWHVTTHNDRFNGKEPRDLTTKQLAQYVDSGKPNHFS